MDESLNRRELVLKALAGLVGGALGWIPVELSSHGHSLTQVESSADVIFSFVAMAILSGLIGGFVIAAEGQSFEITPQAKRRFLRGFVICFLLSLPATYYSNLAFGAILNAGGWGVGHPGSELALRVARVTGWTMMGLMLGAGVGLASFSIPNIAKGSVGGAIGGAAGGMIFDAIGAANGGLS